MFVFSSDKAICFVFKHVNKSDPEKTFSITLDMDSEGRWNGEMVSHNQTYSHTQYMHIYTQSYVRSQ